MQHKRIWLVAAILSAAAVAVVAVALNRSTAPTTSCVAGGEYVLVTVSGPSPGAACQAISHAGQLIGWTGRPSLPAGLAVNETCEASDSHGNRVTFEATGADDTASMTLVDGALAQLGYKLTARPPNWGAGC